MLKLKIGEAKAEDFGSVENSVKYLLENDEQARKNDMYLLLLYWKTINGLPLSEDLTEQMQRCTSPDTIRRARQKVQALHPELTDPDTMARRATRAEAYRSHFRFE